jgi:predicted O-methyltransferase YrrM
MAVARLRYWMWEKRNPDKPWMCPGTIAFCEAHLSPAMTALEFGSGRSTRWFATKVGTLTSIEHDAAWHAVVKEQLARARIANVDYRLIPLNHPEAEGERLDYPSVPDYVAAADRLGDRSLDFAVVDGHYRTNCVQHLLPKIKPGGYLLVDDINLWPSPAALPIPAGWRVVDDSSNGVKRCVVWQAP